MADNVFVDRDRSKVVPRGSAEAKWQISREEAKELGLLESAEKPVQQRRTQAAETPTEAPKPKKRQTRRKRK